MMPRVVVVSKWLAVALVLLTPAAGRAQRLNRRVLEAFQSVVSAPAKSTVRVYGDGHVAALGTVVRPDGYIVTKASELKGKTEVQVHDGRKLPATLVASDDATDLALLKIEAQGLPVIAWAEGAPPIGSWLATPGLDKSPVAIGVVSVSPRKIAAPGAALGVRLMESPDVARIESLVEDMPAEKAGMQVGDIVRRINGKTVKGRSGLQEAIREFQPDDKVDLVVERDGVEHTLSIVLGSMAQLVMDGRAAFQNGLGTTLSKRRSGFPLALQHDTVLEPSECGGPIVDLDGKAVGLNIARAGRVESYALPASLARESIDKLLAQAAPAPADSKLVDKQSPESDKKIQ
jgi:serine protease Do